MQDFWKVAVGIAGLGAVASFVLWSLYKNWLKLPIFQQMTKEQQFSLFRLFIWLTFAFAVLGLVAYAVIQLAGPAARASENSVNELVELVRARRVNVLDLIDRQDTAFTESRQEAAMKGEPTKELDAKIKLLRTIRERFDHLAGEYITALDARQFVRSHELLRDIHGLLDDPQTRGLFLVGLAFGKDEPVYIPTRRLTRAFFDALPKDLEQRAGAALPQPDPFGQDYPDPPPKRK